jgi:uncharacterized membrane protein HdeD (DUF308 family)
MENQDLEPVNENIRHWYVRLILGIVFIVIAVWVFMTPKEVFAALAILFSFTFLITGAIEIISSIIYRKEIKSWGWSLTTGILDFLVGVILISRPGYSMLILALLVGIVVLYRSIIAIIWALKLKKADIFNWQSLLVIGLIGTIFAVILLFNPFLAGLTIVFFTGISFLSIGAFQIYFALVLRKMKYRSV